MLLFPPDLLPSGVFAVTQADVDGRTPFDALMRQYNLNMKWKSCPRSTEARILKPASHAFWKSLDALTQAYWRSEDRLMTVASPSLLHGAARACEFLPVEMTDLIFSRYSKLISIDQSRLLHLVITNCSSTQSRLNSLQLYQQAYFIERLMKISTLDSEFQLFSTTGAARRTLLCQAIASGLQWNIPQEGPKLVAGPLHSLFLLAPEALEENDGATGLYPVHLACTIPSKADICKVDTIYNLLRLNPQAVKQYS